MSVEESSFIRFKKNKTVLLNLNKNLMFALSTLYVYKTLQ